MNTSIKKIKSLLIIALFAHSQFGFSKTTKNSKKQKFDIRKLALPSEVKDVNKKSGAIFYSPSVKDKVLIPVHFWGEVNNAGLHFVPIETNLINAISFAGGPKSTGRLDNIRLTRNESGELKDYFFDLKGGGDSHAYLEKLRPDDTIYIEQDDYLANRSYYTSLIGVIATILSSILLYREVKK